MLMEFNSKEGAAGRNVLMRQGEELMGGRGMLGATFCCGKNPAVAGGAANSRSGQLGGPVAVRRRRFPNRLSETLLQRWRWLERGSGDGGGASVLSCPQPPSESAADSPGLGGLGSSRVEGGRLKPELWEGLSCPPAGQPDKWVGERQTSVSRQSVPSAAPSSLEAAPTGAAAAVPLRLPSARGCGQNWPL